MAIQRLRRIGTQVTIEKDFDFNDDRIRYADRIDFFTQIGLSPFLPVYYSRHPGENRFTEITPYDRYNYIKVARRICLVVIRHIQVDQGVQQMLDFCLTEIMDNVLIHSAYPKTFAGQGWCTAQHFPLTGAIRLIVADSGIGIHRALTSPAYSKYKGLSEWEAICHAVRKGVTNGEGMGFGLYATLAFIRLNGGEMFIYSGCHYGSLENGVFKIKTGAYWHGTIVYLRIKTNRVADYKSILPPDYPLEEDFAYLNPS